MLWFDNDFVRPKNALLDCSTFGFQPSCWFCWSASYVAVAAAANAFWYIQRCACHQLWRWKCLEFWRSSVERDVGQSIDRILGRCTLLTLLSSSLINVETFSKFFASKVTSMRYSVDGSVPSSFSELQVEIGLSSFAALTADEVSATDPVPSQCLMSWCLTSMHCSTTRWLKASGLFSGRF